MTPLFPSTHAFVKLLPVHARHPYTPTSCHPCLSACYRHRNRGAAFLIFVSGACTPCSVCVFGFLPHVFRETWVKHHHAWVCCCSLLRNFHYRQQERAKGTEGIPECVWWVCVSDGMPMRWDRLASAGNKRVKQKAAEKEEEEAHEMCMEAAAPFPAEPIPQLPDIWCNNIHVLCPRCCSSSICLFSMGRLRLWYTEEIMESPQDKKKMHDKTDFFPTRLRVNRIPRPQSYNYFGGIIIIISWWSWKKTEETAGEIKIYTCIMRVKESMRMMRQPHGWGETGLNAFKL